MDAIVLCDDTQHERIGGLTLRERGVRVAKKVGATRVVVFDGSDRTVLDELAGTGALLVVRADQLVHPPLVAPLVDAARDGLAIAVGPDGAYAGAFLARGDAAATALAGLGAGESDTAVAERASTDARIPHGAVARHPARTPEERRAAHRYLYRILDKPQDNMITRHLFRPVSSRLTRLLVWTPVTPNQVSILVGIIVAFGVWLAAHESMTMVIAGTATILGATYLDCCDGEIARVKLLSSRFGAWIDTIVDELSSIAYMLALGWHCHLYFGRNYLGDLGFDPWLVGMAIGAVTYAGCMYFVYYNIIVAVGSANSQDYVGRFQVVPGSAPASVRLAPVVATPARPERELPRPLQAVVDFLPNIPRRDFIVWVSMAFVLLHWSHVCFAIQLLGGVVTFVIVGLDHVHLQRIRRSIRRAGQILESPS